MVKEHMPTTIDNEFNPFTQFEDWNKKDIELGHNTLSKWARLTDYSNDWPKSLIDDACEDGARRLLENDYEGIYILVTESDDMTKVAKHHRT